MPQNRSKGAERAAAALTAASIPNLYAHTGGNCYVTLVPLGHDNARALHVEERAHLTIIGDECSPKSDRFELWVRPDLLEDDTRIMGGAPLVPLVAIVQRMREAALSLTVNPEPDRVRV